MALHMQLCEICGKENNVASLKCVHCGSRLYKYPHSSAPTRTASDQLAPGTQLRNRYKIIKCIGEGGMGTVYRAADLQLHNRPVAIKEMTIRKLSRQDYAHAVKAFEREAHILATLQHPQLPSIYEYFFEEGYWYLVMEYINGQTLGEYFQVSKKKSLPLEEALDIGIQLCSVLEYLHSRQPPIIFRDLKPGNIMRTNEGHIFLIDFGIARHFKPGQPKDTGLAGSQGYASPEQYGSAQSTARSDIYSLGATLHFLLTGDDPVFSPLYFVPLNEPGGSVPAELDTLVQQMLQRKPENRPASVTDIKKKLQGILFQKPHEAPTVEDRSMTFFAPADRSMTFFAPAAKARPEFSIGTLLLLYQSHSDCVTTVGWAPNGQYIASGSRDGTARIWDAATGKDIIIYREHMQNVTFLQWSPSGKFIASGDASRTIHVWNAATGTHLITYKGHNDVWAGGDAIYALAWSPDEKSIVSVSGDHKIHIWDVRTGKLIIAYPSLNDVPVKYIAWSPDGKYLASVAQYSSILNASDGRVLRVYRSNYTTGVVWSPNSLFIAAADSHAEAHQPVVVNIWSILTKNTQLIYRNHTQSIMSLSWSKNGESIASADKNVYVWSATTGQTRYVYQGHKDLVLSVAWSPDSTRIASAGADSTVQIWQAAML